MIEIIPGNCYRVQEKENSKPEIVHHDRLKPYRPREIDDFKLDWVERVQQKYAEIRGQLPRNYVSPTTGEDSQMNRSDTEHEKIRDCYPYDEFTTTDVDTTAGEENSVEITTNRRDSVVSHAAWQPPAEEASEHSAVASHQEWSADAPHTVEEAESADEYSVPRLRARKEVIVRRPDAEGNILTKREWIPLRKRQRDTVIESSSDSEINSSIHLADSQFLFEDDGGRPNLGAYGLRRRIKRREIYSP